MKLHNITFALTLLASPAYAQHYHHGGGGGNWVGPFVGGAIVGGVLGGALANPYAPYYAAPYPYYTPQPLQPSYHWDCPTPYQCNWVWRY